MTAETTQGFPPHLSLQAHRGAAGLAPENTLAAFRMALDLGADGTEMDLQVTKDGIVVVIHDDTVDRTTDGRGRIGDLTLTEIKRLDAGAKFGPAFRGERIPTLRELIDLVKASGKDRFRLNLEIKFAEGREGQPADLEERVLAVLTETNFLDRVITQSFYHPSAAKMKRLGARGARRPPGRAEAAAGRPGGGGPRPPRGLLCTALLAGDARTPADPPSGGHPGGHLDGERPGGHAPPDEHGAGLPAGGRDDLGLPGSVGEPAEDSSVVVRTSPTTRVSQGGAKP